MLEKAYTINKTRIAIQTEQTLLLWQPLVPDLTLVWSYIRLNGQQKFVLSRKSDNEFDKN